MPVSLSPTATVYSPNLRALSTSLQSNDSSDLIKKKVKTTTKEMVEKALIELHNKKGVSLRKIYSFITSTFQLETLTKIRLNLIKKHLHNLQNSDDLVSVTGRGLNGHFKLVDKAYFLKKINDTSVTMRTTTRPTAKVRNEPKKRTSRNRNTVPVEDIEMLKRRALTKEKRMRLASIYDTPMEHTYLSSTSTPFVTNAIVPGAPEVAKRLKRKGHNKVQEDDISTPRSSLSNKKRRLNKIAE